jgi:hypothetical protein
MLGIAAESYKDTKNWHTRANNGDFIKDMGPQRRSVGMVIAVDEKSDTMRVRFPKIGKLLWIPWKNHGHYVVV